MGEDYCLANYKQFQSYWKKIEGQTDRLKVVSIGKTEEGRDQLMGILTSPANHKKLDRYREIARRLARAEGVTPEEARKLADEGKAVVWIDGGLHASEVLCAQALIESVYRLATAHRPRDAPHPRRRDRPVRPREPRRAWTSAPTGTCARRTRSGARSPACRALYEKYAGHDNNRDFYAANLAETRNMNRVMYREWFPQIVMDHHQTGPAGAVMFIPPCRDPFNYNLHPMVVNGIERGQRRDGRAVPRRGQARRDRPHRRAVLDVVERRALHDLPVPQHDRAVHRDDRQPHPVARAADAGQAPPRQRLPLADPAAGVALPAVGRVHRDGQPGDPRLRLPQPLAPACTTSG